MKRRERKSPIPSLPVPAAPPPEALRGLIALGLDPTEATIVLAHQLGFPPNYLAQLSASDMVGGNVGPNQSIVIAIDSGSAVVYGSTPSNTGQGSTFQIAARVVQ